MADVTEIQAKFLASLADLFAKNWQQFAPGETLSSDEIQARSKKFAAWFAETVVTGDPQLYATKTLAERATNEDGTLNAEFSSGILQKGAAYYSNFKASEEAQQAQPPIAPATLGEAGDDEMEIGGDQAPKGRAFDAAPQNAADKPQDDAGTQTDTKTADATPAAAVIDKDKPEGDTADQSAKTAAPENTDGAQKTGADQNAAQGPENPPVGQGHYHQLDPRTHQPVPVDKNFKLEPYDWSENEGIYAAFSHEPEFENGNGTATKEQVRNVDSSRFFELNYPMMRNLAVYYGGYEEDPKFQKGLEDFARARGIQVADLLKPDQKDIFEVVVPNPAAPGQMMTAQYTAQQAIHDVYSKTSLLMGDPMAQWQTGKEFDMQLKGAGFTKKGWWERNITIDQDYVLGQTGNNQIAFGSSVCFVDAKKNMYQDNGDRVRMLRADGQRFNPGHAINMARIFISARQNPMNPDTDPETNPQRIKFVITPNLKFSGVRSKKKDSKYAQSRDMTLLGILHESQRAGIVADIHVKNSQGELTQIGDLDINDLNPTAVEEYTMIGIDVGKLIDHHNNKRFIPAAEIHGDLPEPGRALKKEQTAAVDATSVLNGGTPAPASTAPTGAAPADATPSETPKAQPLSTRELAVTPLDELTEKLGGKDANPNFKDAVKKAQLGARLMEISRDPKLAQTFEAAHPDDADSDDVKAGINTLADLQSEIAAGREVDTFKAEAKGEELLKDAEDRMRAVLGEDDTADKLKNAISDFQTNRPEETSNETPELPVAEDAIVRPADGAPVAPKSGNGSSVFSGLHADPKQRIGGPRSPAA